tara:strand:- start:399 stop:932 length:534 start_codon:yes stop_codon:yes gene_type:complete
MEDLSFNSITGAVTSNLEAAYQGTSDLVEEIASGETIEEIFEPEPINIDLIESEVFRLVNQERSRNGVSALTSRDNFDSFSRSWSEKMINENFYEHSNLEFSFNSYAGENIALTPIHSSVIGCGSTYDEKNMASCIVDGWISSPGHHENMINPQFSFTGIGVACDGSECKSTQVFMG